MWGLGIELVDFTAKHHAFLPYKQAGMVSTCTYLPPLSPPLPLPFPLPFPLPKETDFGLAHMRSLPGYDSHMISRCGTLSYMAPEVLNTKHEYTKMCDVWSLGVIMDTL